MISCLSLHSLFFSSLLFLKLPNSPSNNGCFSPSNGPKANARATAIGSFHKIRPAKQLRRPNLRRRRPLRPTQIATETNRIHRHTGGVREGRAEESEARVAASSGRGEADPIGAARDWTVHGDGGSEQRHRRVNHRVELLRSDP